MTELETIGVNCECGAHHEPGHIVVAAVEGLRLRPEGLMVDPSGFGLACYHDTPEDSDSVRERNIRAVLAGFAVEKRYREERHYPPREEMDLTFNRDNVVARIPTKRWRSILPARKRSEFWRSTGLKQL